MSLTLAFMGTPEFAVPALEAVLKAGHRIALVLTQPPRKAGRGMAEQKSAVHRFAEQHGLPVATPRSLKEGSEQDRLRALKLDLAIVVAYGQILPRAVLDIPRLGCLNVHASLLPRWRGAAPIHRAIMAGDRETGVMIMQMEEGLDTGPILATEKVPIGPQVTTGDLHDRLANAGAHLLVQTLAELEAGKSVAVPQSADGVTYAHKIDKAESRIDWREPARVIDRQIRGLSPFPGAYFEIARKDPVRIKILRAHPIDSAPGQPGQVVSLTPLRIATGQGALEIERVQRAGKAPMEAGEWLRGFDLQVGEQV